MYILIHICIVAICLLYFCYMRVGRGLPAARTPWAHEQRHVSPVGLYESSHRKPRHDAAAVEPPERQVRAGPRRAQRPNQRAAFRREHGPSLPFLLFGQFFCLLTKSFLLLFLLSLRIRSSLRRGIAASASGAPTKSRRRIRRRRVLSRTVRTNIS